MFAFQSVIERREHTIVLCLQKKKNMTKDPIIMIQNRALPVFGGGHRARYSHEEKNQAIYMLPPVRHRGH